MKTTLRCSAAASQTSEDILHVFQTSAKGSSFKQRCTVGSQCTSHLPLLESIGGIGSEALSYKHVAGEEFFVVSIVLHVVAKGSGNRHRTTIA